MEMRCGEDGGGRFCGVSGVVERRESMRRFISTRGGWQSHMGAVSMCEGAGMQTQVS